MIGRRWTFIGIGAVAELFALALWPFVDAYEVLLSPFLLLTCASGMSGAWIIVVTLLDLIFHRRRGQRALPLRSFDLVLGTSLLVLALLQLRDVLDHF